MHVAEGSFGRECVILDAEAPDRNARGGSLAGACDRRATPRRLPGCRRYCRTAPEHFGRRRRPVLAALAAVVLIGGVLGAQTPAAGRFPNGGAAGGPPRIGQARVVLARVLERPEFRRSVLAAAADRLRQQWSSWFLRTWERIAGGRMAPRTLALALAWIVTLSALAALSSLIVRAIMRARLVTPLGVGPAVSHRKVSGVWAREALAAADPREAVRCLYNAAICRLEEEGAWRADAARTPREYVRLLPAGHARRAVIEAVAALFEQVWYPRASCRRRRSPARHPRTRGPWMRAFRPRDLTLAVVALAVLAALSAAGMLIVPATEASEDGSSYSASPRGGRAAFLTLVQLGYRVERSLEPLTAVSVEPAGAVLIVADPIEAPSNQDRRALWQFLERGGTVLAAGRLAADFLDPALAPPGSDPGSKAVGSEPEATPREVRPAGADALTRGVESIDVVPGAAPGLGRDDYRPLFGTDGDAPVRIARIGRGRAIWAASATPLTNDWIAKHDNLQWLLNIAGTPATATVIWDERYHGHARSMWSYIGRTPLPWALAQIGLIALAAAATFSRRRGPVRPRVEDPRTAPMEFVETIGALYGRVRADRASVDAARCRLRRLLTEATGLPAGCTDRALARAAAPRVGIDPDILTPLLAPPDAGDRRSALEIVRDLQRVAAAITREQRGGPRLQGNH